MKISRPKIGAELRRILGTLSHELAMELRRLNSARIGREELSSLAPRNRVLAVKAALAAHHKGSARCC